MSVNVTSARSMGVTAVVVSIRDIPGARGGGVSGAVNGGRLGFWRGCGGGGEERGGGVRG